MRKEKNWKIQAFPREACQRVGCCRVALEGGCELQEWMGQLEKRNNGRGKRWVRRISKNFASWSVSHVCYCPMSWTWVPSWLFDAKAISKWDGFLSQVCIIQLPWISKLCAGSEKGPLCVGFVMLPVFTIPLWFLFLGFLMISSDHYMEKKSLSFLRSVVFTRVLTIFSSMKTKFKCGEITILLIMR
jgi:hypothetical protein